MRYFKPQWKPSAKQRRAPIRGVLEISALASVMLAILALLMGPSLVVVDRKYLPVDMARTQHALPKPLALREDAIIIVITRDGSIYCGNARVTLNYLSEAIRDAVLGGAENVVYVKADARAKYGDVQAIYDRIQAAGVKNITFLTESPRP